ncbi:MAG: hypothetical protein V1735_00540 [Nanoarchaeota archaeon]
MSYNLRPVVLRGVLPQLVGNVSAIILLYFGVRLNLGLLKLDIGQTGSMFLLFLFASLGVLFLVDSFRVLKLLYLFSYGQVFIQGKNVMLRLSQPVVRQNVLDKAFGTCSLTFADGRLEFVPYDQRIISYIGQLASYRAV